MPRLSVGSVLCILISSDPLMGKKCLVSASSACDCLLQDDKGRRDEEDQGVKDR